jgi:hypothetical protein
MQKQGALIVLLFLWLQSFEQLFFVARAAGYFRHLRHLLSTRYDVY